MKKNKTVMYFLGVAVVLIWGLIGYRIFDAVRGNDDGDFQHPPVSVAREAYNDYAVPKDTTRLQLNYKDPFAVKKEKDTSEIPIKKMQPAKITPKQSAPAINWGFIKYSGYIHNPGSKNVVALVSIGGRAEMMTEGETMDNVKLVKNLRDSIQVSFNGKTAYIKIHSGTL